MGPHKALYLFGEVAGHQGGALVVFSLAIALNHTLRRKREP